jgi:hypothetical protein
VCPVKNYLGDDAAPSNCCSGVQYANLSVCNRAQHTTRPQWSLLRRCDTSETSGSVLCAFHTIMMFCIVVVCIAFQFSGIGMQRSLSLQCCSFAVVLEYCVLVGASRLCNAVRA